MNLNEHTVLCTLQIKVRLYRHSIDYNLGIMHIVDYLGYIRHILCICRLCGALSYV